MEDGRLALTAVYLKLDAEYFGFIEELPAMNSRGRTLHDTRTALHELAAEVFAEERRTVAETHTGGGMLRESFFIQPPPPAASAV
jgi:predicted RNase H-like HicB family nuclease